MMFLLALVCSIETVDTLLKVRAPCSCVFGSLELPTKLLVVSYHIIHKLFFSGLDWSSLDNAYKLLGIISLC